MFITFKDRKLRELAEDQERCQREMGYRRAKLFQKRLFQMENALNLEVLVNMPGHFHPLKGVRRGQWACALDQPFRLVFEVSRSSLMEEMKYGLRESDFTVVNIIEIVNYHGK